MLFFVACVAAVMASFKAASITNLASPKMFFGRLLIFQQQINALKPLRAARAGVIAVAGVGAPHVTAIVLCHECVTVHLQGSEAPLHHHTSVASLV